MIPQALTFWLGIAVLPTLQFGESLFWVHNYYFLFIQVKVIHVSNASRLWVTILEHIPATKGDIPVPLHDPMEFKKLSLDLAHYYSIKDNKKYHGNIFVNIYIQQTMNYTCT